MSPDKFYQKHTKLTRSLKKFVSDQQAQISEENFDSFLDVLSEELERLKDLVFQSPAGPLRAKKVQELVDLEMAGDSGIPVSCVKGCNHCCHFEVEITNYEAQILKAILSKGHTIDRARLEAHCQRTVQDPAWRDLRQREQNRCVFLGREGSCEIYESRPVMCRRHSVTSPPKNCESLESAITLRYFPRVDLILSAANEDPDLRVGPMAKMLLLK